MVTSSEADDADGAGAGHTKNDIQDATIGSADFDIRLRAERDGNGPGRTYRIGYTATDCFGDAVEGYTDILVPSNQGETTQP